MRFQLSPAVIWHKIQQNLKGVCLLLLAWVSVHILLLSIWLWDRLCWPARAMKRCGLCCLWWSLYGLSGKNACINGLIMRDRGGWIHSLVLTEPHLYLWDKTLWFSHKEETDNDITVNVASSPFTECHYFYCQLHKDIPWADVSVCVVVEA